MTTDLEQQIRTHFRGSFAESEEITRAEVEQRSEAPPAGPRMTASRLRYRGAWVFAVAFAITALLLGVFPLLLGSEEAEEDVAATAPSVVDGGMGPTVEVVVSGVSAGVGGHLAGVLYEGELAGLDGEAVGGFWSLVGGEASDITEVVRSPAAMGDGLFPFVSSEAALVENGTYTLVLWVDTALNPVSRWVPINTDGMGLQGCHVVFEVDDAEQTRVEVSPTFQPDGWNIDCTTGQVIPGTDTSAVSP